MDIHDIKGMSRAESQGQVMNVNKQMKFTKFVAGKVLEMAALLQVGTKVQRGDVIQHLEKAREHFVEQKDLANSVICTIAIDMVKQI